MERMPASRSSPLVLLLVAAISACAAGGAASGVTETLPLGTTASGNFLSGLAAQRGNDPAAAAGSLPRWAASPERKFPDAVVPSGSVSVTPEAAPPAAQAESAAMRRRAKGAEREAGMRSIK